MKREIKERPNSLLLESQRESAMHIFIIKNTLHRLRDKSF